MQLNKKLILKATTFGITKAEVFTTVKTSNLTFKRNSILNLRLNLSGPDFY
jgi:hypothetical protein